MNPARSKTQQKLAAGLFAEMWPAFKAIIWRLILAVALFTPAEVRCGEPALTEYQVKALCLVNFARYTEWPAGTFAGADAPLVIGIMANSQLATNLQNATSDKKIGGRSVVVRELSVETDCDKCQVLFVGASETKRLAKILERVKEEHILTVGETESFLQQGGMINFAMRGGRVRFDVDLNTAHHMGLQISSKVLSLADTVHSNPSH